MMKFTRTTALMLCLSLIFLCACSATSDTGISGASTSTVQTSVPATSEPYKYTGKAPVTDKSLSLSLLTTNGGSKIYNWESFKWFTTAIKLSGVDLKIEMIDSATYNDVCKTRLASGSDLADIIRLPGNDSDMTYIKSGLFIELTDYYKQFGYNINKIFDNQYASVKAEITTPDNKIYYVPSFNPSNSMRVIMYNTQWLNKLNLKPAKDMDEFYNILVAFSKNDLNGTGGTTDEVPLFMRSGMTELFGIYWGLDLVNGWNADKNGVVTCSYAAKEYYDFLLYFNKLYKEHLLYNEFATANLDTQNALFSNNQVGVIMHFISNLTGYSKQINPKFNIKTDDLIMQTFDPPKGPYGNQTYYGNTVNGNTFWGISKSCKKPEEAFKLLDFMLGDEAMVLWYGIEGVDYNLDKQGRKIFTDIYINNVDSYRNKMGHNCLALPNNKNNEVQLAYETEKSITQYEKASPWVASPMLGFCYTLPSENEIVSTYKTDISTYCSEMFTSFITGTTAVNEDKFQAYLKKLDALHVKDLTAIYQAQYSRTHK